MRKFEVMLALDIPEVDAKHTVDADGFLYTREVGDLDDVLVVLFVKDDVAAEGEPPTIVKRPVFATPVRCLAYIKEVVDVKAAVSAERVLSN